MDMDSGSDSDNEFCLDSFRLVRRSTSGPSNQRRADADAMYAPTPAMAALSPDPPSSPMSADAHSQQPPGTDGQAADALAAPMALEWQSPDPPPTSESGASRRSQPTSWQSSALTLRPPHTVESIFDNYMKRRGALIRALTEDEETFFQKCDPGMQPLHLYGATDGTWEVKPPEVKLPPAEPEPTSGINIYRDTMERHEWLQQVAKHSDAWLFRISSFAASYFTATERVRLFAMFFDRPTVFQEILLANNNKRCIYHVAEQRSSGLKANAMVEEEKETVHHEEENRSSCPDEANEMEEQGAYLIDEQRSVGPIEAYELQEEIEDDNNRCASCDNRYRANAFWIFCDKCKKWYHGKCVDVTSREAEHIKYYECPDCYLEKVGHA